MGRELKGGTASKGTRGEVWKLKGWRPDKEEVVGMARTGVGVELLWSLRSTDEDLLLVTLKNDFVCVCAHMFMRKQTSTTYVQVPPGTRREH